MLCLLCSLVLDVLFQFYYLSSCFAPPTTTNRHSEAEPLTFLFYSVVVFTASRLYPPLKEVCLKRPWPKALLHRAPYLREEKKRRNRISQIKEKQTIFHPTRDDSLIPRQNNKSLIHISVVCLRSSVTFVS